MQASFIILQSPFHRNILLPCYANKLLKRLMSSLLESYRPACIQIVCSCTCTAATIDTIQLCYSCVHCPVIIMHLCHYDKLSHFSSFSCVYFPHHCQTVLWSVLYQMWMLKSWAELCSIKNILEYYPCSLLSVVSLWKSFKVDHKVHKFIIMNIITSSVNQVIFVQNVCESG